MSKNYLFIVSLVSIGFFPKAQTIDTNKIEANKTDIELVYGHYLQDGNNSAVTGGKGTEELTVYSTAVSVKKYKGKNTYSLKGGADIISSASTDNIDYEISSASILDTRSHLNFSYGKNLKEDRLQLNIGTGGSIESDYSSFSINSGIDFTDSTNMSTYSAQTQFYFDDLRWGLLDEDYKKPSMLIYPIELSDTLWHNEYRRNSFNLKLGYSRILNQRNILGVFSEITYQEGLLSTPFHRIFFNDGSRAVEQLPNQRWKGSMTVRLNSFVGGRVILKNAISGYLDNFGIQTFSIENETAIKITPFFTLKPNARIHVQSGSDYFAPRNAHDPTSTFFTSDYDLSSFKSYRIGLNSKLVFREKKWATMQLDNVELGYSFYKREDGLSAHILVVKFSF